VVSSLLVSSPILLCLIAVYLAAPDAVIAYIAVVAIWLLAFIITTAITVGKSKIFIAFTSARVIFIQGKNRIDLRK
jgi:uncharacterized membrane protein YbhN (UPF0104 family)